MKGGANEALAAVGENGGEVGRGRGAANTVIGLKVARY